MSARTCRISRACSPTISKSVCDHAEVLVIGKRDAAAKRALDLVRGKVPIVDLVRVDAANRRDDLYDGICW